MEVWLSENSRAINGIVTSIDADGGFGEVDGFEVKEGDEIVRVFFDPDAVYDFPGGHLNAHRGGAEPVRAEAELQDGKLVATSIADADS